LSARSLVNVKAAHKHVDEIVPRLNSGKVIARLNAEIFLIFDARSGNLLTTWIDKDLCLVESLGPFQQPMKLLFQRSLSFVSKYVENVTSEKFEMAEKTVIDLSHMKTVFSRILFGCIIHGLYICVVQEEESSPKDPFLLIFDPNDAKEGQPSRGGNYKIKFSLKK